jgi:hypothetical protein
MSPIARHFLTHKPAENPQDCQDSFYADPKRGVFAVADGAGGSFFPREWAQCLTAHFASDAHAALRRESFAQWLRAVHEEWESQIARIAQAPEPSYLVVTGYRSRRPATAAFFGLQLGAPNNGRIPWQAVALGDSCLFHAGAGGCVRAYPLTTSQEFSYGMHGLSSYPDKHVVDPLFLSDDETEGHPPFVEGDFLVLTSDALAAWLLRRQESGQPVWGHLLSLKTAADFEKFVAEAREEAEEPMQPDDVSLIVVPFGEPHTIYTNQAFLPAPARGAASPQAVVPATAVASIPADPPMAAPARISRPLSPLPPKPPRPKPYHDPAQRWLIGFGLFVFVAIAAFAFILKTRESSQRDVASLKKKVADLEDQLHLAQGKIEGISHARETQGEFVETRIQELRHERDSINNELASALFQLAQLQSPFSSNRDRNSLAKGLDAPRKSISFPDGQVTSGSWLWFVHPEPDRIFTAPRFSIHLGLREALPPVGEADAPIVKSSGKSSTHRSALIDYSEESLGPSGIRAPTRADSPPATPPPATPPPATPPPATPPPATPPPATPPPATPPTPAVSSHPTPKSAILGAAAPSEESQAGEPRIAVLQSSKALAPDFRGEK